MTVGLQLRELFVREYRMIYRLEEARVTIIAFFHGRRDFESASARHLPVLFHDQIVFGRGSNVPSS